jgi:hypothetical protein
VNAKSTRLVRSRLDASSFILHHLISVSLGTRPAMEEDPSKELFEKQPPPLYETLGLDKDASEVDIRTAYRRRALLSHPDKLPPSLSDAEREEANQTFLRVCLWKFLLLWENRSCLTERHRKRSLMRTLSSLRQHVESTLTRLDGLTSLASIREKAVGMHTLPSSSTKSRVSASTTFSIHSKASKANLNYPPSYAGANYIYLQAHKKSSTISRLLIQPLAARSNTSSTTS